MMTKKAMPMPMLKPMMTGLLREREGDAAESETCAREGEVRAMEVELRRDVVVVVLRGLDLEAVVVVVIREVEEPVDFGDLDALEVADVLGELDVFDGFSDVFDGTDVVGFLDVRGVDEEEMEDVRVGDDPVAVVVVAAVVPVGFCVVELGLVVEDSAAARI